MPAAQGAPAKAGNEMSCMESKVTWGLFGCIDKQVIADSGAMAFFDVPQGVECGEYIASSRIPMKGRFRYRCS